MSLIHLSQDLFLIQKNHAQHATRPTAVNRVVTKEIKELVSLYQSMWGFSTQIEGSSINRIVLNILQTLRCNISIIAIHFIPYIPYIEFNVIP